MSPKNLNVSSKTHKNLLNKLRDKRIFQIYRKFENILKLNQNFIVGVSGGPDSLALCFLTKIYSINKSCYAYYYIVDHRLRKNSSTEAQSVKKLLKKYNIKSDILKWYGKKPISNIQSLARNKRYSLLINQAKKLNIKTILTGHHIDDLYENFFIRILRGSGLNGLVSLSEKTLRDKVDIVRPLISFEKRHLNYKCMLLLTSCVSMRRTAIILNIHPITVARKLVYMAAQSRLKSADYLNDCSFVQSIQFDELQTIEKKTPLHDLNLTEMIPASVILIALLWIGLWPRTIAPRIDAEIESRYESCLLYTSPSPRDRQKSRMPSSA